MQIYRRAHGVNKFSRSPLFNPRVISFGLTKKQTKQREKMVSRFPPPASSLGLPWPNAFSRTKNWLLLHSKLLLWHDDNQHLLYVPLQRLIQKKLNCYIQHLLCRGIQQTTLACLIDEYIQQCRNVKLIFSKKATKIDEIFTVDLKFITQCQIYGEDFINFCGLLRKHELYRKKQIHR